MKYGKSKGSSSKSSKSGKGHMAGYTSSVRSDNRKVKLPGQKC